MLKVLSSKVVLNASKAVGSACGAFQVVLCTYAFFFFRLLHVCVWCFFFGFGSAAEAWKAAQMSHSFATRHGLPGWPNLGVHRLIRGPAYSVSNLFANVTDWFCGWIGVFQNW